MKLPWFRVAAIGASLALGVGATLIPQIANASASACGAATQVGTIDGVPHLDTCQPSGTLRTPLGSFRKV